MSGISDSARLRILRELDDLRARNGITKVRVDDFTAEHQGADTLKDQARPERVDIWRGVTWIGQWYWVPQTGIGDIRHKTTESKCAEKVLGKIAAALREKGV